MKYYTVLFLSTTLVVACNSLYNPVESFDEVDDTIENEMDSMTINPLNKELLFYYKDFKDATTRLVDAIDSSQNGNDGVITRFFLQRGSSLNKSNFIIAEGDGLLTPPSSINLTNYNSLTFSTWVRSYSTNFEELIFQGTNNNNTSKIRYGNDRIIIGSDIVDGDRRYNEYLFDGEWHMLTIVLKNFDKSDAARYSITVDGDEKIESIDDVDFQPNPISPLILLDKFDGEFDNVRLYSRQLSDDEILQLYNLERVEMEVRMSNRNLISYYTFDENNAIDSKEGINGTVSNIDFVNDTPNGQGKAAFFKGGDNSFITLTSRKSMLDNINSFSTSFWMKSNNKSYQPIIRQGPDRDNQYGIETVGGFIYCGTTNYSFVQNIDTLLLDNNWHMVVITCDKINQTSDANSMKLFIDNQIVGATDSSNIDFSNRVDSSLYIGYDDVGTYFQGYLDNIRFYNKSLTAEDVSRIYNLEK